MTTNFRRTWRGIRSTSALEPAHHGPVPALLVLAVAAAIIEAGTCAWIAFDEWRMRCSAIRPCNCMYEVYREEEPLGAACFDGPRPLSAVLSSVGVNKDHRHIISDPEALPCETRVILSKEGVMVRLRRVSGSHLLMAGKRIDLNAAESDDLEAIPGIGPVLSRRIIEFRAAAGPFSRVSDLKKVRGVGERQLRALAPYLELDPVKDGQRAVTHQAPQPSP
ncbi:MAG: helix-hairpin-helix domain-containing protein [Pseudomonadota bacterium]